MSRRPFSRPVLGTSTSARLKSPRRLKPLVTTRLRFGFLASSSLRLAFMLLRRSSHRARTKGVPYFLGLPFMCLFGLACFRKMCDAIPSVVHRMTLPQQQAKDISCAQVWKTKFPDQTTFFSESGGDNAQLSTGTLHMVVGVSRSLSTGVSTGRVARRGRSQYGEATPSSLGSDRTLDHGNVSGLGHAGRG